MSPTELREAADRVKIYSGHGNAERLLRQAADFVEQHPETPVEQVAEIGEEK